jgi:DNA/RNA endonuclease YhcR with UshA esterase domain
MVAGASLRGMLGNRMQAEFAATEDVTGAVAITGMWVPTAALLNYCGAGGYVSDVSQPEKNKIASRSHISRFVPAFQVAHEVPIDQNTGKKQKTSKLKNSFGTQEFCFRNIVSNYLCKCPHS